MARSHRPEIHNIAPYYDDFSEDKNFARVLFKLAPRFKRENSLKFDHPTEPD